jgi:hypothetical protein
MVIGTVRTSDESMELLLQPGQHPVHLVPLLLLQQQRIPTRTHQPATSQMELFFILFYIFWGEIFYFFRTILFIQHCFISRP